ncbi:MAG TPA: hypothetical protein VIB11_07235 [Pedococcus sp.]|jgi:hypothetical protein|uniref:hypothetical protein n=1 Tax=Pedococcus sp. TaxID=2860345 RepID=UPI002F92433D
MVTMPDDPEINDEALGAEIELLGEIITAATDADRPLTDEQLDTALGVGHDETRAGSAALEGVATADGTAP